MKFNSAVTFNCEEKNFDEIYRQTKIYYFIEWWNSEYIVVEVERKAFCLEWSIDLTEIGGEDGLSTQVSVELGRVKSVWSE